MSATAAWIPGWECPLQKSFARAISPDMPTIAPITTLMGYFVFQVSRALEGRATGPEAFTFLLKLLSTYGVVFADDFVPALLVVCRQVTAGWPRANLWWPMTPARSKIARGKHGSRPMRALLGVKPVAALIELLYKNSTRGSC